MMWVLRIFLKEISATEVTTHYDTGSLLLADTESFNDYESMYWVPEYRPYNAGSENYFGFINKSLLNHLSFNRIIKNHLININ